MKETWLKITNFSGYEVSSLGRVRSWRIWGRSRKPVKHPRILKPGVHPKGYRFVALRCGDSSYTKKVHRLVLAAFVGSSPDNCECAHLDGNPANNCVNNLRWVTARENTSHKFIHKTMSTKLDETTVIAIRNEVRAGNMQSLTAKKYGISRANICLIVSRQTWRHI